MEFSTEQKLIYDLVYQAQEAGIATVKPGNSFNSPDIAARSDHSRFNETGDYSERRGQESIFPHGTSHHIGLDVHDPGLYDTFEIDMVLTVEPGIYILTGDCDKKWWGPCERRRYIN
jgi:Xaa-Pro aminopeptidase